jgi:putative flavoprotein involved in K+ transport
VHITPTIVIGAGQAGLALSRELSAQRHPHVVLERGRIGERWRSQRWDSLSLLTPNWLSVLPGAPPPARPDGFRGARELVRELDEYARSFHAPVAERTTVLDVRRESGRYSVRTDREQFVARSVVVATGDSDLPRLPAAAAAVPGGVLSLHASSYRSPGALPPGAVLVVGAGPSGQQLALELRRAGRRVILSASDHARAPRRYRGRDIFVWLAAMGDLQRTLDELPASCPTRLSPAAAAASR